jgi:hypothetical protein
MKTFVSTVFSIAIIIVSMMGITYEYNQHVTTVTVEPTCARMVEEREARDGVTRDVNKYCSIEVKGKPLVSFGA